MKNLEQYLKENFEKNIIDHSIRATVSKYGDVTFYIHANGFDSDTLDFWVEENRVSYFNSGLETFKGGIL